MEAHPYANRFPMLPQGELEELAESIRENGLRQPVVLDTEGRILDGRNRSAACELVGITPETVVYEGDDLAEYVIDCNTSRRHMSTGARAMATALILADDGKRGDGRWRRGSVVISAGTNNSWRDRLSEAGIILDWTPEVAPQVVAGELPLKVAYAEAVAKRNAVDAEKQRAAIEANRKREATIREQQENDRKLAALTAEASPFMAQVEDGTMTIAVAYAAHQEDTRKLREEQRQIAMGWRDTCMGIAERVRGLDGGEAYGHMFLTEFYPHEDEYVPDGMRLTRARLQSAIEFLETVKKGVTR